MTSAVFRRYAIAAGGLALFASAAALAYIPPSGFIVKKIAATHALKKQIRVRSTVTAMDGEKALPTHFKETTVYDPSTGTLVFYAYNDANQRMAWQARATVAPKAGAEPPGLPALLLFASDSGAIVSALHQAGIPVGSEMEPLLTPMPTPAPAIQPEGQAKAQAKVERKEGPAVEPPQRPEDDTRLARWNGAVAWVIGKVEKAGKKGEQPSQPELWVEKDSFLPLRLSYAPQPDGPWLELDFANYHHYREYPLPREITVIRKGATILKEEIQDVAFASEFPESKLPSGEAGLSGPAAAPSDVAQLIQDFGRILR